MAFTIDEAFLPATLTAPPMTDWEFAEFCAEHPDLVFEMTAEGEIVVSPPAFSITGARNATITWQLRAWAEADGRGIVFDSSSGFALPNGARRAPDSSWVLSSRIKGLEALDKEAFLHLCPDFVIELKSTSDRLRTLRSKMKEWIDNGAQLAWLIDPDTRSVEIFRPGKDPELCTEVAELLAEPPIQGFVLNLKRVWDPFGT